MQEVPVFRVELLPARHGDCIWLEYGFIGKTRFVLIDGGPATAFGSLERRIERLPLRSRRFELLVASHIDSDHTAGILQLLSTPALGAEFKEIWFNGWEQLRRPIGGFSAQDHGCYSQQSAMEEAVPCQRVPTSALPWNSSFGGNAICLVRGQDPPELSLEGGLRITLLSPDVQALMTLRRAWGQALAADRGSHYRAKNSAELSEGLVNDLRTVTGRLDDTVANGSSIAFLAEFAGKRCAFLADAESSTVESSLRRVAERRGEWPFRVDAVKVSHHGSKGNTTQQLLNLIDCSRFLISTDGGRFMHPDDEAIARLVEFGSKPTVLNFNYRSARTKLWDVDALKTARRFETVYAPEGEALVVDLMQGP